MLIKTLVENTKCSDEFIVEHGLSLYVETAKHKLLFDLGMSGIFEYNALKLGVNIEDVDTVIISHGHNDHGGAIAKFLTLNSKAKIFINKHAFEKHLSIHDSIQKDIGLDLNLINNPRIVLVDGNLKIDDELFIFNDTKKIYPLPSSNENLFMIDNNSIINDDFKHEQNLIIQEEDKSILFAGCAHNGILNIIETAKEHINFYPNYCVGGFHLTSMRTKHRESDEIIMKLAKEMSKMPTKFYTCHCTGEEAYNILKSKLNYQLDYLHTGTCLEI